jgi:hypothetical protein
METNITDFQSRIVEVVSAILAGAIVWPIYGAFERRGHHAAGIICSAVVLATVLEVFIYSDYIGRAWFRMLVVVFVIIDALLTIVALKVSFKPSSTWLGLTVVLCLVVFTIIVNVVGRRFEGHPL